MAKVLRGGFRGRRGPAVGLVLGAGGVVGQAYQAGVLAALQREIGWDPRHAAAIVGTSAGAVTGAALRVGVPGPDLAASLYGAPRRARAAPSCAASSRPTADRCRRRPSSPCCGPGTCPRPRSSPGWPAGPSPSAPRWPSPRWSPGARSTSANGPGASTIHRRALARRAAHLRRPAQRRCPRRLRPAGVAAGPPGRGRAGLVRHPGLLPPRHHRRHRVRRRGHPLGDQRRRAEERAARPGDHHLVDVVGPRQRQRRRRAAPAHPAPAHGARGRQAARAGTPVICLEPESEARHVMGLRAMAEDRRPRVIEAAYEETRRRILETPFLATLGQPGAVRRLRRLSRRSGKGRTSPVVDRGARRGGMRREAA